MADANRDGRTLLGRQPARTLLVDLSPAFSADVCHDLCDVLENLFSLACHISGPSRIPFFSVIALCGYPELLLPFSYVKNNFPRIQTAISDVRGMVEEVNPNQEPGASCIDRGLAEACTQYRRQLQSTLQMGGFCHQLEIVVVTCQNATDVQRQCEAVSATLDLEHLKRIQVLSLSGMSCLPLDNLSLSDSQTSAKSGMSDTNSISGVVEVVSLEPDILCLQNFFNGWLLDTGTDSEHLHIVLPPATPGEPSLTLKCDLHERILHPSQLPHHSQFTVHSDSATMKLVFPSTSKAMGMVVPIYKLCVTALLPVSALCDSVVFGMPMVVDATACWKIDWDELEKNQQHFKALCRSLFMKGQVMIAQVAPSTDKPTGKNKSQVHQLPQGSFVLLPANNGTLLVKSLAVQELLLPCNTGNQSEEIDDEKLELINSSLSKLEILDTYNPLLQTSGLYDSLKNHNKKPTPRQQKRHLEENSTYGGKKQETANTLKVSRGSSVGGATRGQGRHTGATAQPLPFSATGSNRSNTAAQRGSSQKSHDLWPGIGGDGFDEDCYMQDENTNVHSYRGRQRSRGKPALSFPTTL